MRKKVERSKRGLTRRGFIRMLAAGAAAARALPQFALAQAEAENPPNLIVIMVDDCSAREFGCYGHPAHKTPNLDHLAETGVMFKTCWATPICSPTRAEIMTGRYGFRTKWYHNDMKVPEPLTRRSKIFSQILKDRGYATAIAGKWQLIGTQAEYGFDEHCMWRYIKGKHDAPTEPPEGTLPGRPARYWHPAVVRNNEPVQTGPDDYGPDIFVDFINDFVERHKDGPFLVYYPMCLTHKSWDFDRRVSGYLPTPALDDRGRRTGGRSEPTLQANVEYTDYLVGRIVKNLDRLGIRDRTVLMFTCDNGTAGYGKARVEYERGPLVPMIVNCPGIVKPIGPCDELVDLSDVLPTLADLAGANLPDDYAIDGHSFAPILRGETGKGREWIFCHYADKRMLRDKRWLLDGNGRFYDCGNDRSGDGYKDVTDSTDPDVVAARQRFEKILANLPAPAPDDPLVLKYREKKARKKAWRKKRKKKKLQQR